MTTLMKFTVEEYDRMIQAGVFADRLDHRIELIYGEVRKVKPPNPPHEDSVDRLNYWSISHTKREEVRVRIQNSLGIPEFDSVPEPDVAWMTERNYRERRPEPADVLLLIEVADSSLRDDRCEKAGLYAKAGIPDYWIVNVKDECIEVHRHPIDGVYSEITTFKLGQSVSPLCQPDVSLSVDCVMGRED